MDVREQNNLSVQKFWCTCVNLCMLSLDSRRIKTKNFSLKLNYSIKSFLLLLKITHSFMMKGDLQLIIYSSNITNNKILVISKETPQAKLLVCLEQV